MTKVVEVKLDTRTLDKWIAMTGQSVDKAMSGIAFQVEGEAKNLAPVATGALKNSLNTQKQSEAHYTVSDGVEYGIYQELGTGKMSAHPFMIPAVEKARKYIKDFVKRELDKIK
jgi:HK97 gp10 family phage protein